MLGSLGAEINEGNQRCTQNTACSINTSGRAAGCGAPPGHARELVGSRCLLGVCKHQQDGSPSQGERSGPEGHPKATGLRGEKPHKGSSEQGNQHGPSEEVEEREEMATCLRDTKKNHN